MIDTQAIRNKILDLAIRGRLTDQFPEDGNAEVLYQQIQEEKAALIKEGKIKKSAKLPDISADDIPFEIPQNWKWVNFGAIITLQSGQDLKATEYNDEEIGIPYLTGASNFDENDNLIINRWTPAPKNLAFENDVLISCKGTVGKIAVLHTKQVHIARQFMAIRTYLVSIDYIKLFMESVVARIKTASKGLIPGIERKDILNLHFPLPPYAEQERIANRVGTLFDLLKTIDDYQDKYISDFALLKSKIIDAGIRGELTEQLPEDGTAEELYKQILSKKAELIKEKKIKKSKPLPEITEEEIPFDIPDNWKWVRLGEFGSWQAGATPSRRNDAYYNGTIPWLKTGELNDGEILSTSECITELALEECSLSFNPAGSVLIAMYGATIGKLGIAQIPLTTNQACCACVPSSDVHNRFLFYLLMSMRNTFIGMGIGGAQSNISKEKIVKAVAPLPPYTEQKRIVERIEELLAAMPE